MVDYVYIEVDDCFGKIRNNKWAISKWKNRMIVIHNGKDKNGNYNKTILLESKAISSKNISIEELANIILSKIIELYQYKKLIVIGDGAKWMKHLSKLLNAEFVLDNFHWKKKAQDTLGYQKYKTNNKIIFSKYEGIYNKSIYKIVVELIENCSFDSAIQFLNNFIDNFSNEFSKSKMNEIRKLVRYLKSNKSGLIHFNEDWYIGSRTEAFIATWIKRRTKAKNSLFGFDTFKFLLRLNESENLRYVFI